MASVWSLSWDEAVKKTDENLEERAQEISNMLKNHTYKVGLYKTSKYFDRGKHRILYKLPYYPDRITMGYNVKNWALF